MRLTALASSIVHTLEAGSSLRRPNISMASFAASPQPRPQWSTWPRAAADAASSALAAAVFAFLDVLDALLCLVYALLDGVLEESPVRCYCHRRRHESEDEEVSDTLYLYARRSAIREALVGLLFVGGRRGREPAAGAGAARWSDCACESCVAWRGSGGRLHVVVKEPEVCRPAGVVVCADGAGAAGRTSGESVDDNAIFLHGFSSSSSFWAETVFREEASDILLRSNCRRLLAVDLLGFGQSPKPGDCMYRLRDHVEAIERSVIQPLGLTSSSSSFHLVSHSMGCVVALALAAKHPHRPYFLAGGGDGKAMSQVALHRLAEKKLWPPLLFGSAVMSWYEHVGRTVCLFVCKNHRLWERLLTVDFRLRDLTRHTHHSAWHTMHNVICGGARLQDANLEAVQAAGIPVQAIHGVHDRVVPVECSSRHLKAKLPTATIRVMDGCDHATVVLGRERDFAHELQAFWSSAAASG